MKRAHQMLADCRIPMGPSKISRLVRQFQRTAETNSGVTFEQFLVNAVQVTAKQRKQLADATCIARDHARQLSYLDPTGETAVGNVVRAHK